MVNSPFHEDFLIDTCVRIKDSQSGMGSLAGRTGKIVGVAAHDFILVHYIILLDGEKVPSRFGLVSAVSVQGTLLERL